MASHVAYSQGDQGSVKRLRHAMPGIKWSLISAIWMGEAEKVNHEYFDVCKYGPPHDLDLDIPDLVEELHGRLPREWDMW